MGKSQLRPEKAIVIAKTTFTGEPTCLDEADAISASGITFNHKDLIL